MFSILIYFSPLNRHDRQETFTKFPVIGLVSFVQQPLVLLSLRNAFLTFLRLKNGVAPLSSRSFEVRRSRGTKYLHAWWLVFYILPHRDETSNGNESFFYPAFLTVKKNFMPVRYRNVVATGICEENRLFSG